MTQKHIRAFSAFLVLLGGAFLLRNVGYLSDAALGVIWPILFVLLGVYLWGQKG